MYSLELSILKTISYFDIFSYPLTYTEIIYFLDSAGQEENFNTAITHLIQKKQVYKFEEFYTLRNNNSIIARRKKGNQLAQKQIKKAKRVASFLWRMPFVKGIAISGSLSKNFADENSDLDFFIITTANRLWVVRFIYTILFKVASVLNLKDWFCLNYFIDETNLAIMDRNIFTAVEVATLKPLKGKLLFENFFNQNDWICDYLPNYNVDFSCMNEMQSSIVKSTGERILNFIHADKLNDKLLNVFKKRFHRMMIENIKTKKGITIGAYEASKHACRPLPQYFQPKILTKFNNNFEQHKKNFYRSVINKEKQVLSNE